jgi:hypothetical protein
MQSSNEKKTKSQFTVTGSISCLLNKYSTNIYRYQDPQGHMQEILAKKNPGWFRDFKWKQIFLLNCFSQFATSFEFYNFLSFDSDGLTSLGISTCSGVPFGN